jgi:hypothetical protein
MKIVSGACQDVLGCFLRKIPELQVVEQLPGSEKAVGSNPTQVITLVVVNAICKSRNIISICP